jgi:hypothetical protein
MDYNNLCIEENWKGQIPIKLVFPSEDLSAPKPPDDLYLMCSRFAYFHYCAEIAIEYFRSFALDLKSDIWFESAGIPIRR